MHDIPCGMCGNVFAPLLFSSHYKVCLKKKKRKDEGRYKSNARKAQSRYEANWTKDNPKPQPSDVILFRLVMKHPTLPFRLCEEELRREACRGDLERLKDGTKGQASAKATNRLPLSPLLGTSQEDGAPIRAIQPMQQPVETCRQILPTKRIRSDWTRDHESLSHLFEGSAWMGCSLSC